MYFVSGTLYPFTIKIEHAFRVAELAERYAASLQMCVSDTDFAWFCGLFLYTKGQPLSQQHNR